MMAVHEKHMKSKKMPAGMPPKKPMMPGKEMGKGMMGVGRLGKGKGLLKRKV